MSESSSSSDESEQKSLTKSGKQEEEDIEAPRDSSAEIVNGVITIPRDYSRDGIIPAFEEAYPNSMRQFNISRDDFLATVRTINAIFRDAETLTWRTVLEGCLGCLTFFTLFLCIEHQYKKALRELDSFLRSENERVYYRNGLQLLNPIYNGLLQLEFKILTKEERKEQ